MRTIIIDVDQQGAAINLALAEGRRTGQVVLVLSDDVQIAQPAQTEAAAPSFHEYEGKGGFPPRRLTEHTIVQVLREHGGSVRIRDEATGWNIYDEIAARLGVSVEARRRVTPGTGEPAWRPEVGFCRKNLEVQGVLEPTAVSGRGVWTLRTARM